MIAGCILTVAQSKGGAGKTTLVSALAAALAGKGYKIAVIDSDANQQLSNWFKSAYRADDFACHSEIEPIALVNLARNLASQVDIVLTDTAGFESTTATNAIGMADYVLVPCMADRGSLIQTLRTIKQVQASATLIRRNIPHAVVRTRWRLKGEMETVIEDNLKANSAPLMNAIISNLSVYAKIGYAGFDGPRPKDLERMSTEIDGLIQELVANGAIRARS